MTPPKTTCSEKLCAPEPGVIKCGGHGAATGGCLLQDYGRLFEENTV